MINGRPKGGKNRKWSKEEKLRIVKRYLDEGIGRIPLAKEENIASGLLYTWIKKYLDYGEEGLENKRKTGNHFAALTNSKSLTEVEMLRLIIAKQEIEIERLKKGYQVKGDGVNKEFVTIKNANSK
ncbi:transposase [Clostridium sp. YIM B02551]|uniref:transposase n=1 Tax=Clostridium sp. YIM B02551 TaxID=2910679 RepID=UPI001EE9D773|nr:transposase [Clostridium sp. YIM B02551]